MSARPWVSPVFLNKPVEFLLLQAPRQAPDLSLWLWLSTLSKALLGSAISPAACLVPTGGSSVPELHGDLGGVEKGALVPSSVFLCHLGPKSTLCVSRVSRNLSALTQLK